MNKHSLYKCVFAKEKNHEIQIVADAEKISNSVFNVQRTTNLLFNDLYYIYIIYNNILTGI